MRSSEKLRIRQLEEEVESLRDVIHDLRRHVREDSQACAIEEIQQQKTYDGVLKHSQDVGKVTLADGYIDILQDDVLTGHGLGYTFYTPSTTLLQGRLIEHGPGAPTAATNQPKSRSIRPLRRDFS